MNGRPDGRKSLRADDGGAIRARGDGEGGGGDRRVAGRADI